MSLMLTKYGRLCVDMNEALKNGDKLARKTISDMVAAIDKASVAGKVRVEITDELVDSILLKYKKALQESIDTCPDNEKYAALKNEYCQQMVIVDKYAPKVIDDPIKIKEMITEWMTEMGETQFNKKIFMPKCKQAMMDMKIVNQVVKELGAG